MNGRLSRTRVAQSGERYALERIAAFAEIRKVQVSYTFPRACCGRELPGRDARPELCADQQSIVDALADGPLPLKVLTERSGVERTRCGIFCSSLKERGFIETTDDGYRLIPTTGLPAASEGE